MTGRRQIGRGVKKQAEETAKAKAPGPEQVHTQHRWGTKCRPCRRHRRLREDQGGAEGEKRPFGPE